MVQYVSQNNKVQCIAQYSAIQYMVIYHMATNRIVQKWAQCSTVQGAVQYYIQYSTCHSKVVKVQCILLAHSAAHEYT